MCAFGPQTVQPTSQPTHPVAQGSSPADGGGGLTSLDQLETPVDRTSPVDLVTDAQEDQTVAQRRLHRPHERTRCRVLAAFAESGDPTLQRRAFKMSECCRWPAVSLSPQGQVHTSLGRCRDRLCPLCQTVRSNEFGARLRDATMTWDSVRHIVLTLAAQDAPLADQLDHLQASFRRLRQQTLWKRRVIRGVYSIEVTLNHKTGQWHPHLHVLIEGSYIPQDSLSEAWKIASGGSRVVWIELMASREGAARYVSKYVTKPSEIGGWPADAICEYAHAITGRRMIDRFGRRPSTPVDIERENETPAECTLRVPVHRLLERINEGNRAIIAAAETLARASRLIRLAIADDLGGPIADWTIRPKPPSQDELIAAYHALAAEFEDDAPFATRTHEPGPAPPPPLTGRQRPMFEGGWAMRDG